MKTEHTVIERLLKEGKISVEEAASLSGVQTDDLKRESALRRDLIAKLNEQVPFESISDFLTDLCMACPGGSPSSKEDISRDLSLGIYDIVDQICKSLKKDPYNNIERKFRVDTKWFELVASVKNDKVCLTSMLNIPWSTWVKME